MRSTNAGAVLVVAVVLAHDGSGARAASDHPTAQELQAQLETADEPPPLLHAEMADLYRQKVTTLAQALEHSDTRTQATEALRGLIDAIVLTQTRAHCESS